MVKSVSSQDGDHIGALLSSGFEDAVSGSTKYALTTVPRRAPPKSMSAFEHESIADDCTMRRHAALLGAFLSLLSLELN